MSAPLACAGLAIGHGRREVARDIALTLERATVTVLLGPNRGGGTTLLRTLLGLPGASISATRRCRCGTRRAWRRRAMRR